MSHPNWSFLSPVLFPKNVPRSERLHARVACGTDMEDIYKLGYDQWGDGIGLNEYLCLCKSSRKYQKGTWILFGDRNTHLPMVALICYQIIDVFDIPVVGIGSLATDPKMRSRGYASEALTTIVDTCNKELATQLLVLFPDKNTSMYKNVGFIGADSRNRLHGQTIPMYYRTKQARQGDVERALQKIDEMPYF